MSDGLRGNHTTKTLGCESCEKYALYVTLAKVGPASRAFSISCFHHLPDALAAERVPALCEYHRLSICLTNAAVENLLQLLDLDFQHLHFFALGD